MKLIALAAIATLVGSTAVLAQETPAGTTDATKAGTTEGTETSDRSPGKKTTTPESQVDTTKQGETSDRSPGKHDDTKMAPDTKMMTPDAK
jgi:hypothetical protein